MNSIRQNFNVIAERLSVLSWPAKMLLVALLVIAGLSMFVVAGWSGRIKYIELLPGMSVDHQKRAGDLMDKLSIPSKTENGKLYVTADQQYGVLAMLQENGGLPGDTKLLFGNMISSQHWMNTKSQNDEIRNQALQNELGMVISKMRGIKSGSVYIEAPDITGLGAATRRPTAAVAVMMASGSLTQATANAIAAFVSSAKAGLKVTDVKVIDQSNNRQFSVKSVDELDSSDYLESVAKIEDRVRSKLQEALGYVPGVIVSVTAQIDNTRRQYTENKIFEEGKGSVSAVTRSDKTSKKETAASGAGEAGTRPNVGTSLADGQGGGSRTEDTTNRLESRFVPGSRVETVIDGRGNATKLTAMVSLPREYLILLVRQGKAASAGGAGGGAPASGASAAPVDDVTQAEIDAKFKEEKTRLETDLTPQITTAIAGTSADTPDTTRLVTVSMIPVPSVGTMSFAGVSSVGVLGASGGGGGAAGGGVMSLVNADLVKNVVLGGFAIASVGMMFMLVKKSSRPLELPTAEQIVGIPPALEAETDIVGEADESMMAMEGVELMDDQVKTKKMLEQVQDMVQKNPSDAAALMNLWLTADQ